MQDQTDPTPLDVPKILADGHEHELWAVHQASVGRAAYEHVRILAAARGDQDGIAIAEQELARLPEVSALDGLAAAHALIRSLTGRRWIDMRRAREQGATWRQIGEALGMTRQAATDYYRRTIAEQERYNPQHDAARARAALDDGMCEAPIIDNRPTTAQQAYADRVAAAFEED